MSATLAIGLGVSSLGVAGLGLNLPSIDLPSVSSSEILKSSDFGLNEKTKDYFFEFSGSVSDPVINVGLGSSLPYGSVSLDSSNSVFVPKVLDWESDAKSKYDDFDINSKSPIVSFLGGILSEIPVIGDVFSIGSGLVSSLKKLDKRNTMSEKEYVDYYVDKKNDEWGEALNRIADSVAGASVPVSSLVTDSSDFTTSHNLPDLTTFKSYISKFLSLGSSSLNMAGSESKHDDDNSNGSAPVGSTVVGSSFLAKLGLDNLKLSFKYAGALALIAGLLVVSSDDKKKIKNKYSNNRRYY